MNGESPLRFRVHVSKVQMDKLKQGAAIAKQHRETSEFVACLKEINFRLEFEADEWGESRDQLENLEMEVRFGSTKMLSVWYGVNKSTKQVFVKEFLIRRQRPKLS